MTDYVPVSCELYDRLEEVSLRKKSVALELNDAQGRRIFLKVRIADLISENREEFAMLDDGERIRLDRILKLH
ncbi:hypothetical protein CH379_010515 [Leptospira ellisii]|uniref:Transcriptional antiterminator, Rof n=1 Tax=Leptospira ellisii TaxID=2023197 RepID=A0A2N0BI98_9LEPT|nr:hypothetical protein [Leptospira ellisii]MDV6236055.1 hypothetical protein [Leptospira ellisii]PJZ94478.1 hypothetical protein CH379_02285 [Leptospira ellisii]PKA03614.1 hypothetical protein CH375_15925 [Leptospira ellisii]